MKKLFGEIDLNWKKLIIFAVIAAIYTALMAIIPIFDDTSFSDIATYFEWWILFGIIIIVNSKSPKDSALKCFIFFLISQPLIYLLQVPFSPLGWGLFKFYKYWFIWTLLTIPMGYIGYYIKKKNIFSVIIVLPMLLFLALLGIGYMGKVVENFPHHLLSFIVCFIMIIVIVLNLFDRKKERLICFIITLLFATGLMIWNGGIVNNEYETYKSLNDYNLVLDDDAYISSFIGTKKGDVTLNHIEEGYFSVTLNGRKGGEYTFTVRDNSNHEYNFEYYYDENDKTVILKKTD